MKIMNCHANERNVILKRLLAVVLAFATCFTFIPSGIACAATDSDSSGSESSLSKELDAGTYTVSANVSMLTPLGITAYATNPQNPLGIGTNGIPSAPVKDNAELVVSEDGTRTLTFELVNPVFTVQDFSDGDNVTVVSKERVDIEEDTTDSSYIEEVHEAGYTTRVSSVVVTLGDWGGTYEFKDCSEFATALRATEELSYGKFNIPLKLTVDYANAVRHVDGSFDKTFVDEITGVELAVEAEETSAVIDELRVSEFKVSDVAAQDKDAIGQALSAKYKTTPAYKAYDLSLIANGNVISTDDKVKLTASFTGEYSNLYLLKNGTLTSLTGSSADGETSAELKLGTVICVESEGADAWEWSHTYTDSTTGASITYATDTSVDDVVLNGHATGDGAWVLDWYNDYCSAKTTLNTDADSLAKYSSVIDLSDMDDCQVDAVWAVSIDCANQDFPTGLGMSVGEGHNCLKATLPISNDLTDLYIVSGTVGSLTSATKVASSVSRGYETIDLISSTTSPATSSVPFHNAVTGCNVLGEALADDAEVAYIVVVSKKTTSVDKPVAASGLVYTGKEQVGVASGEGYTLSGDARATEAGVYEVIATLKKGYVWSDGTTDPVTLSYIISPKKDDAVTRVDVYRVYNPYTGEHHYTSSALERDACVAAGWNDEGVAWVAPSKSSDPVYRVYNPYTGDHHYTMSAAERDACVAAGWSDEGTGWYSADSSTGAKVYRGYNPYATVGIHHYTTSEVEIRNMVDAGWSDEGTGWYSLK